MWGKREHNELRGQICSGSGATGAQQLRVQGRSELGSSRDTLLWAGTGRCITWGWREGEEQGVLCLGRRWLFWVKRVKFQAAAWKKPRAVITTGV